MENEYLKEQITRLNGGQPIQPIQQMLEQQLHLQNALGAAKPTPISSAKSR